MTASTPARRRAVRRAAAPLAALSIALAATAPAPLARADTLVDNVNGITIGEAGQVQRFTGLWIADDGKVAALLAPKDRRPRKVDYTIDGDGRTLLPGMIDAHGHIMQLGFAQLTLDLTDTRTLDEALARIGAYAADHPDRPWIVGRGWNQEQWGLGRFPTAAELDRVTGGRPTWLERVDGHAGWANSAALDAAGITAATADPQGGRIERVAGSKAPAGVLVDGATALVEAAVPQPRAADRDAAFALAQTELLTRGVTAMADMGTAIEDWQAYRRAGDADTLRIRVMAYAMGTDAMTLIAGSAPSPWLYDDRLKLEGVKLYLDGALGSRGAWLKQPYADDPGNRGLPLLRSDQLRNLMTRAAMDGFQIAVHAIGDAANAEVLDAVAELGPTFSGDRRWRIEHAQIVDPADIPRFAGKGIIASMQPVHMASDKTMAQARLGSDRLGGAYAWRAIAAAGGKLAFGSDAPVETPDPWAGFATAIARTDAAGQPVGGWLPSERVSRQAALAAYTADAAYAGFAETRFGRLVPGMRADFVLVDTDPLVAEPDRIRATRVLETWVGGARVYADPSRAGRHAVKRR